MSILAKGMVLKQYIGRQQGIQFDIDAGRGMLLIFLNKENIEKYPLGGRYEFAFKPLYNTIFLCVKFGNFPWASAPYSPHLSQDFEAQEYPEGTGMPLTVVSICVDDGVIYGLDLMALSNEFSNVFHYISKVLFEEDFSHEEHRAVIEHVYAKYPTDEELEEECEFKCTVE